MNPPAILPAVLYVHGGGWILGNAGTHDRLVRELAVGAQAAIVFVERKARGDAGLRVRAHSEPVQIHAEVVFDDKRGLP